MDRDARKRNQHQKFATLPYPTIRDLHIADIRTYGRMAWQKTPGYNQRSRGETLMGRWKAAIDPKLKARAFENQKTEAKIGVRILNRMTNLGAPVSSVPPEIRLG